MNTVRRVMEEAGYRPPKVKSRNHDGLFDKQHFFNLAEMRRQLAAHLHWYNHGRTHHALGGILVPADRYYGRADEVTALVEAGAGREQGLDTLDLRPLKGSR